MIHYAGRLIDHVHLVVRDLERSRAFYEAALRAVGRDLTHRHEKAFASDELYVSAGNPNGPTHLAFRAKDREAVHRFWEAACAAGGRDNGAPGERPYHPGYYAAFVLDPDGNNIEVVFHGEAKRSAPSVVIEW